MHIKRIKKRGKVYSYYYVTLTNSYGEDQTHYLGKDYKAAIKKEQLLKNGPDSKFTFPQVNSKMLYPLALFLILLIGLFFGQQTGFFTYNPESVTIQVNSSWNLTNSFLRVSLGDYVQDIPTSELLVENSIIFYPQNYNLTEGVAYIDLVVDEVIVESHSIEILPDILEETPQTNVTTSNETDVEEEFVEVNETIVTIVDEELTEELIEEVKVNNKGRQYKVMIGEPVKWEKKVQVKSDKSNLKVKLPKETIEIIGVKKGSTEVELGKVRIGNEDEFSVQTINDKEVTIEENVLTDEEVSLEYYTEGPWLTEEESLNGKKVTIGSDLHYEEILAGVSVSNVPLGAIKIYWKTLDGREEVDFDAYDKDGDNLIDYVEWVVPHTSEQEYEIEITILNPVSYLKDGDEWKVLLDTTGQADLKITAIDSSFMEEKTDDSLTFNELEFLSIECGSENLIDSLYIYSEGEERKYTDVLEEENLVVDYFLVKDYTCSDIGEFKTKVHKAGYAILEFDFGGTISYAYDPEIALFSSTTWTEGTFNQTTNTTTTGALQLSTDAVLVLDFDNGVGNYNFSTNLNDLSPAGNSGTSITPQFTASCKYNGCYDFDGTDDRVIVYSTVVSDFPVTASAWFKTSASTDEEMISLGDLSSSTIYHSIYVDDTSTISFKSSRAGNTSTISYTGINPDDSSWHNAIMIIHNDTYREFYVDGVFAGYNDTLTIPITSVDAWSIGSRLNNAYSNPFDGNIDCVQIWNKSLNGTEVQRLYTDYRCNTLTNTISANLLANNNSDFTNDLGNWTIDNSTGGGNVTWDNGRVKMTQGTSSVWVKIGIPLQVESSKTYRFGSNLTRPGYSTSILTHYLGTSIGNSAYYSSYTTRGTFSLPVNTSNYDYWTSTINGTIWFTINDGNGAVSTSYIDDVIFEEVNLTDENLVSTWDMNEYEKVVNDSTGSNDGDIGVFYNSSGVYGGALQFDGVDDNIVAGKLLGTTENISELTLAVWLKPQGSLAGAKRIISKYSGSGTTKGSIILDNQATGKLRFAIYNNSNAQESLLTTNQVINTDGWYHVVATYKEGEAIIYVNGTQIINTTFLETSIPAYNYNWFIGEEGGVAEYWNGSMDDVRIYNRALSSTEISDLYAGYTPAGYYASGTFSSANITLNETVLQSVENFTLSGTLGNGTLNGGNTDACGWDGVMGCWALDGSAVDGSGNGNDGVVTGALPQKYGRLNSSYWFDGTNDYIDLGTDLAPILSINETSSVSLWFNSNDVQSNSLIFQSTNQTYDRVFIQLSVGLLYAGYRDTSSHAIQTTVNDGEWYHVVYTIDDTSDILYVNGVAYTGDAVVGATWVTSGTILGSRTSKADLFFEGYMDNAIIFNRTLTASEVAELYDLQSSHKVETRYRVLDNSTGSLDYGEWSQYYTANGSTIYYTNKSIKNIGTHIQFENVLETQSNYYTPSITSLNFSYNEHTQPSTTITTYNETGTKTDSVLPIEGGTNVTFNITITNNQTAISSVWITIWETTKTAGIKLWEGFLSLFNGIWSATVQTNASFGHNTNYTVYANDTSSNLILEEDGSLFVNNPPTIESAEVRVQGVENTTGLVAYWKLEKGNGSHFVDSIGSNNGTCSGTACPVYTAEGGVGGAYEFDGDDDYVNIANTSLCNFGYQDFTVMAWVKTNSTPSSYYQVIAGNTNTQLLEISSTGSPYFYIKDSSSTARSPSSPINILDNQWHHIAVIHSYSTNTSTYSDGVYVASDADSYTDNITCGSSPLRIGSYSATGREFNGTIDQVMLFNRALTVQELQNIYNSSKYIYENFADMAVSVNGSNDNNSDTLTYNYDWRKDGTSMAVLNMPMEPTSTTEVKPLDYSTNANTATLTTPKYSTDCKYNGCYEFDGTDDYLKINEIIPVSNFTNSLWFKRLGDSGGAYHQIISGINGDADARILLISGGTVLRIELNNESNVDFAKSFTLSDPIDDDQWHNLLWGYNGTYGYIYVDGTFVGNTSYFNEGIRTSTATIRIGSHVATYETNGSLDCVQLWNDTLTLDQILEINSSTICNTTYQSDSLVSTWAFDDYDKVVSDSLGNYDGDIGPFFNTSGINGQAMQFDGVDDYLRINADDSFNFSYGTWMAWVNLRNVAGLQDIITVSGYYPIEIGQSGGVLYTHMFFDNGSSKSNVLSGVSMFTSGEWTHMALTWNGTHLLLYKNGALEETSDWYAVTPIGVRYLGEDYLIGTQSANSRYLNGSIDELMIFNRSLSAEQIASMYNEGVPKYTTLVKEEIDKGDLWTVSVTANDGYVDSSSVTSSAGYVLGAWDNLSVSVTNGSGVEMDSLVGVGTGQNISFNVTVGTPGEVSSVWVVIWETTKAAGVKIWEGFLSLISGNLWSGEVPVNTSFSSHTNYTVYANTTGNEIISQDGVLFVNDPPKITNAEIRTHGIENSTGLVSYWKLEQGNGSHFVDSIGTNNGTCSGTVCPNYTIEGGVGGAYEFDGVEDYITVPYDDSLNFSKTQQFTISMWINRKGAVGTTERIMNEQSNVCYSIYYSASTYTRFIVFNNSNVNIGTPVTNPLPYKWTHITGVFNGTAVKLYMDGIEVSNNSFQGQLRPCSSWGLYLSDPNQPANATIDEFMIFNRSLSDTEILNLYNSTKYIYESFSDLGVSVNGSSDNQSNTLNYNYDWRKDGASMAVLNMPMEPTSTTEVKPLDYSTNANTATLTTPKYSTDCKYGGCYDFDGTDDYVMIEDSSGEVTSKDKNFTLSTWMYTGTLNSFEWIVAKGVSGDYAWQFYSENDDLRFSILDTGGSDYLRISSNNLLTANTWYHLTGIYVENDSNYGGNATIWLYLNGNLLDNDTTVGTGTLDTWNADINLGTRVPVASNFDGKLDCVQVWNSTLTAADVLALNNSNVCNTTLQSNNLISTWTLDDYDKVVDDSIGSNDGDIGPFYTTGINGKAIELDGVDDYITISSLGTDETLNTSLTIEFWSKTNSPALVSDHEILSSAASVTYPRVNFYNNNLYYMIGYEGTYANHLNCGITDENWHYWTITLNQHNATANNATIYKDGNVCESILTNIQTTGLNNAGIDIGKGTTSGFFNGTIDQLKIYNRTLTAEQIADMYNEGYPRFNGLVKEEVNGAENWTVSITANDGYVDSNTILSTGAYIVNETPTITNPTAYGTIGDVINPGENVTFNVTVTVPEGSGVSAVWVVIWQTVKSAGDILWQGFMTLIDSVNNIWSTTVEVNSTFSHNVNYTIYANATNNQTAETDGTFYTNTIPTISNIIINSTSGTNTTTENLTAYVTTNDNDSDSVNIIYDWRTDKNENELLVDGDMEAGDTSAWTAINDANLTKQTTSPHGGDQVLRVEYTGTSLPSVYQVTTIIGKTYKLSGWRRSDGIANPALASGGQWIINKAYTGTDWDYFDIIFTAVSSQIRFYAITSTENSYTEWDDVSVKELTSDIVLNMPFEQDVSNTSHVRDYSTYGNNGTLGNGSTNTLPIFNSSCGAYTGSGGCYEFDGVDDYIEVGDDASLRFTENDNFTIATWFKTSADTGDNQLLLDKRSGNDRYRLLLDPSEKGRFEMGDGVSVPYVQSADYVNDGNWHYIVGVYNGILNMYLDGVSEGTSELTLSGIDTTGAPFRIGRESSSLIRLFNGSIDQVQIWNRSLSAEEIAFMYNSGIGKYDQLHSNATLKDEAWQVAVTPNDGTEDGTTSVSGAIIINNTQPTINTAITYNETGIAVNATTILEGGQNFTLNVTISDPDNDISSVWVVIWETIESAGIKLWEGFLSLISGNLWSVEVPTNTSFPHNVNYTIYVNDTSNATTTQDGTFQYNYRPTITSLILNSTSGTNVTTDNITAHVTTNDNDSDTVSVVYDWRKNGVSDSVLNMPLNFNNSAGTNGTKDYTTYGNNGAIYGATFNSSCNAFTGSSGCYSFDGSNDYIEIPDTDNLNVIPTMTFSAWIYPTAYGDIGDSNIKNIYSDEDNNLTAVWRLGSQGDAGLRDRFGVNYNDGGNHDIESDGTITLNTWTHVVAVTNGTKINFYFNGALDSSKSYSITPTQKSLNWWIGTKMNVGTQERQFQGNIDQVQLWNRSLSASEVAMIYNSGAGMYNRVHSDATTLYDNWTVQVTPMDSYVLGETQEASLIVDIPPGIDLKVDSTSIAYKTPITQNDNVSINTTVYNLGSEETTNVNVTFYVDEIPYQSQIISSLLNQSNTTIYFSWIAEYYNHTLKLTADPDNTISEGNEANNEYSFGVNASWLAQINVTFPTNNQEIVRGKPTGGLPHEDAFNVVDNILTIQAQIHNYFNKSELGNTANCSFYWNNTLLGYNATNATGHCEYSLDKSNNATTIYPIIVNFTNLNNTYTSNATTVVENLNISLVSIITDLDPLYRRPGLYYEIGDAAGLNITITKNGLPYNPEQIRVNVLNTGSGVLETQLYPQNDTITKKNNGTYESIFIVQEDVDIHWNVYLIDSNLSVGAAARADVNVSGSSHADIEVQPADGNITFNATDGTDIISNMYITIYDQNNNRIFNTTQTAFGIPRVIAFGELFNFVFIDNVNNRLSINGINITENSSYSPQFIDNQTKVSRFSDIKNVTKIIAFNDTALNYSNATITFAQTGGAIKYILKCATWDYANKNCISGWTKNTTSDYSVTQTGTGVQFTIDSFSAYAGGIENNSRLIIYDENDAGMPYAGLDTRTGSEITFFANYTNYTDAIPITTANCTIVINETNTTANMTYNPTHSLFEYSTTFTTAQTYTWNVTCTDIAFDNLSAQDNIIVNAPSTSSSTSSSTSTSTGGGGGGGGAAADVKVNFAVTPTELKYSMAIKEYQDRKITVTNNWIKTVDFEIDIEGEISEFLTIKENSFSLPIGESKEILVEGKAGTIPGLYTGKILVTSLGNTKEIPVTIEIDSENILFDVKVEIPQQRKLVDLTEALRSQITILSMGKQKKVDVILNYIIKDFNGNTIMETSETVAVTDQLSFVKEIHLPSDLESGKYVLGVEALYYLGSYAVSSDTFEVKALSTSIFQKGKNIFPTMNVTLLLTAVLLIAVLLLKRKKRRYIMKYK